MDKSQEERKGSKSAVTQSSCSTMEEYQQEQRIIPYVDSPIDCDLSELFDSDMVFPTREDLDAYVKRIGKSHHVVIITLKSDLNTKNRTPVIYYGCERSGNYRSKLKEVKNDELETSVKKRKKEIDSRKTATKKCNCPFKIKGFLSGPNGWRLIVLEGKHNHELGENLEGHSYVGRLTPSEMEYVRELMGGGVKANEIMRLLKERDPYNVSTLKTIYNALSFLRKQDMEGRTVIQQLFKHIEGKGYFERHTTMDGNAIINIFWAHPDSLELAKCFPHVLLMDCTYKTNRYKMPLLHIVGITSTDLTFSLAYALMEREREDYYCWALEQLSIALGQSFAPAVVVTDRELALISAIRKVFPDSRNFLCRWHISKNIIQRCKKIFENGEDFESFLSAWWELVGAEDEDIYFQLLNKMNDRFSEFPNVLEYVKSTWLDQYKESIVAAWTDRYMHFGCTTTNRVESAHARLKKGLGTSEYNLLALFDYIDSNMLIQHNAIKSSFEISIFKVFHKVEGIKLLSMLIGVVSHKALELIVDEISRSEVVGMDVQACRCVITRTHGLPCAHMIATWKMEGMLIPLSSVHIFWRTLSYTPMVEIKDIGTIDYRPLIELYIKKFNESTPQGQQDLWLKLKEIVNPSATILREPEGKKSTKGRPKVGKKKMSRHRSTKRDPSGFEYVESVEESVLPLKKLSMVRKPKSILNEQTTDTKKFGRYIPKAILEHVAFLVNVLADGNCGFRAVAGQLGMFEDDWRVIRKDLLLELDSHREYYVELYSRAFENIEAVRNRLIWESDGNAPRDHWMSMPDMGHLIASCYNVVCVFISEQQCLTFLPLRSDPIPVLNRKVIGLALINENHFLQVVMTPNAPIPPISLSWQRCALDVARGWAEGHLVQIGRFLQLDLPKNLALSDEFIDLTDT